ncbi:hypothetical protein [Pendulispora albinea]|uniref:Uncharacterized protein n=1 Tax=Pendulispora albinea TaxID=2741071 RepID=A0ABZ2LQK5_9BACT
MYETIPHQGVPPIPWYVRLLENPASPVALAGAVDLFEHDCIHIVLGRGTLPQDEAFVIGFTMGSSERLSPLQHGLFALCSRYVYRGDYRFSQMDRRVFDIAVELAKRMKPRPLDRVSFGSLMDGQLGKLRASLGLDTRQLREAYERERGLWPGSPAAVRLPRPLAAAESRAGI